MPWTSDELLASIKLRMSLPTSNQRLSDTELYSLATDEMRGYVAYLVRKGGRNYWINTLDVAFPANTRTLRIPSLALGATVEDMQWINSGGSVYKMDYVPMGQQPDWDFNTTMIISGVPQVFTIEGDLLYILPRPSQAGTIRIRYERRQSALVPVASCSAIASINFGANTMTVGAGMTGLTNGATLHVDVVQSSPDFDVFLSNTTVTVSGTVAPFTLTFTSDSIPTELTTADYICLAGQTCVVPLPDVVQVALAERTAIVACDIIGDTEGADRLRASLMEREPRILDALTPRPRKSATAAFQRNSVLRAGRSRRGWNGWWG